MSENEIPVRFELIKNGERQAIGGVEYGTTNIMISRSMHDPQNIPADRSEDEHFVREQYLKGEFAVHFMSMPEGADEFQHWVKNQPLAVGDEITVRILGSGAVDKPVSKENGLLTMLQSRDTDYANEVRDAEKAYYAAVDGLLSGLALPRDEFSPLIDNLISPLKRYKQALVVAIAASEGQEQDVDQYSYASLKRFPPQLMATLTLHRNRMGIDTGQDGDEVDESK